jgi:hypothetical protein
VAEVDRIAVAAHMHVLMRRRLGRATDVEWMAKNRDYAMEIIRLATESPHTDLHEWAAKLAGLFGAVAARPDPAAPPVRRDPVAAPPATPGADPDDSGKPDDPRAARRYVTSLR